MKRLELEIPEAMLEELRRERFSYPHPRVQQKMECLLLKGYGFEHGAISEIVGICPNTLRIYLREYQEGGLERLKELHFYTPTSDLMLVKDSIESKFRQHPPATIKEAAYQIESLTGIKRGQTQVRKFLRTLGMERRKVGSVPSKADSAKQEAFKKNELEPRLKEAREGKRAVFFVDAAHFVFAPFLGFLWCFTRLFVKAPSGRQRFNVLGALHALTHQLISISNTSYINAESVCELIWKIAHENIAVPITLVMDNARYQKCALVQQFAATFDIELRYLPSYSPNLNLIERMWKFTKKHCLYSKYYSNFEAFSQTLSSFLANVHLTHNKELDSLLTHNFQSYQTEQLRLAA